MATTQELNIKLTADTSDAINKIDGAKRSFTELNQALELAKKAAGFVADGFRLATEALDRGGKVVDLERSFERLSASAGKVSDVFLKDLRAATEGAINNAELMSLANRALTLDIEKSGVSFVQLTENVKKLANATGQDAAQAIDTATQALATGRTMALNSLGVTVDLTAATQRYAQELGKTAEELTETEQRTARQRAASEALANAVANLGDIQGNAGDSAEALGTQIDNLVDNFKAGFASSEELRRALEGFSSEIQQIDLRSFGEDLGKIAAFAINVADGFIYLVKKVEDARVAIKKFSDPAAAAVLEVERATRASIKTQAENVLSLHNGNEALKQTQDELQRVKARIQELNEAQSKAGILGGLFSKDGDELKRLTARMLQLTAYSDDLRDGLLRVSGALGGVRKNGEDSPVSDEQLKKIKDLKLELKDITRTLETDILKDGIDLAIKTGNPDQFQKLTATLESSTFQGFREGYQKFVDSGLLNDEGASRLAQLQTDRITEDYRRQFIEKGIDANKQVADDLKQQLDDAANFFSDVFYDAFTGKAFDIKNALDKLVSGVLGGALGSIFPGAGQFGNLQGLGQSIGQGLIGQSGGSLLSSFGIGAGSGSSIPVGAIGQNIDGSFIMASGAGAGAGAGGLAAAGAAALPAVASAAAVAFWADVITRYSEGKKASDIQVALSPLLAVANLGVDYFGSTKGPGQQLRDQFRKQFQDSGFLDNNFTFGLLGTGGRGNLGAEKGQGFQLSDALAPGVNPQALGITSGIAQLLTGGNDQAFKDFNNSLANIVSGFSDASNATDNFNLVVANTLGVLDQLGLTAEGAKDQLKNLFLDGQVSLSEFRDGIQGLNLLATENLVGDGSISDALEILANNFGKPKEQLQALEILMNEAKEIGINDISDLGAYIEQALGIAAAATFQKFENAGINSFEDLSQASADQIFLIVSSLYDLQDQFYDTFDISSSADSFERNSSRIQSALGRQRSAAAQAAEEQRKLNEQLRAGVSASNNGGDNNQPLNKTKR